MSSHHIVRDEQEPAIVIAKMENQYWSAIRELLGWTPTVMVAEGCVLDIVSRGIKVDVVICEKESLPETKELLQDQQPIEFLLKEKNSFILTAVSYLKDKGYKGVNIFGGFDAHKSSMINKQLIAIWYAEDYRYVRSTLYKFQKWMVANHEFIILLTAQDQSLKTNNSTKLAQKNTYSCTQDGMVVIKSEANFWIGENY